LLLTVASSTSKIISSVARGTAFEERSLRLLRAQFSMSLTRVGGRSDGGIDLIGWWWLPHPSPSPSSSSWAVAELKEGADTEGSDGPWLLPGTEGEGRRRRRIRVIAQCKAEGKPLGPKYVREMEGVLFRHMHERTLFPTGAVDANTPSSLPHAHEMAGGERTVPMVAVLISESGFSKECLRRAQSSPVPSMLLHLPPLLTSEESLPTPEEFLSAPEELLPAPPSSDTSSSDPSVEDPSSAPPEDSIGSAFWNPALGGAQGLLGGEIEVRWERTPAALGVGRPGLWTKGGERVGSWVPDGASD
jgi:hypothetical protein